MTGNLGLREMRGGELWWILNTAAYGAGGALSSRQVPLGWGCGRTLEKVGIISLDSLDLLWGWLQDQFLA
jgi:hypothetical protein